MTEFWYVHRENSGGPRYKHTSIDSAIAEAKRLSSENGGTYYILRAEAVVESEPLLQYLYAGITVQPPSSPYSESMCVAIAKGQDPDDSIPF